MNELPATTALRARLVFPINAPPVPGGIVVLQQGRIAAVSRHENAFPVRDLGNVAILPGLINAHTHLEFSELRDPMGEPGMPLPTWIDRVIQARRRAQDDAGAVLSEPRRAAALTAGLRECLESGVTTVGDIATWDPIAMLPDGHRPHYLAFRELIGLTPQRVAQLLLEARQFVTGSSPSGVRRGLSPHAPYTAAPDLVEHAVRISRNEQCPLAMHIAESPEELQLLQHGTGPFRELLEKYEVWDEVLSGGRRVRDYLKLLSQSYRAVIIHGNYLTDEDRQLLASQRERLSLAYCPRTHAYFSHPRYPLSAMLRQGIRVVLGTDGRSSNPDLNLWSELQFTARRHVDVQPEQLVRAVTLDAAYALGCEQHRGSLEPGKRADLTIIRLGDSGAHDTDPYMALLTDAARVAGTWIGGEEAVRFEGS